MNEKDELIDSLMETLGYLPIGARALLEALTRPEVIEYTKRYIHVMDKASLCQNYKPPWNCAKEAEARYENIKFGWLGGSNGVSYSDWWCEPCRKRAMEE